jgi:hypothetical protein
MFVIYRVLLLTITVTLIEPMADRIQPRVSWLLHAFMKYVN